MATNEHQLEIAMGRMLQVGVTVAALVVLAGGILRLVHSPAPKPDYSHFHGAPAGYEHIGSIAAGAFHLDGSSMVEFGILLLIATPICRVLFGVVGFAIMKDKLYTAVSAIVLTILLLSFFVRR